VAAPARPAAAADAGWYVQIGSFSKPDNAQAAAARMRALGHAGEVRAMPGRSGAIHRVRIGPYRSRESAEAARRAAEAQGFRGARVAQAGSE
ncbi:MAG: SPOR domain-containing protein, partial [Gammaproteobacteria bacterium]|nr:SPOR domain-containing protein [Gammaproteobacteria bacterium]